MGIAIEALYSVLNRGSHKKRLFYVTPFIGFGSKSNVMVIGERPAFCKNAWHVSGDFCSEGGVVTSFVLGDALQRVGLYDGISLALMCLGGIGALMALWNGLYGEWRALALWGVFSMSMFCVSAWFARYAIASTGRQS